MVGLRKRRPHATARGRERMRNFGVNRTINLLVIPMLVVAIILVAWLKTPIMQVVRYRPVKHIITNPLMGFAAPADANPEDIVYPFSLVHAVLTFKDLEPQKDEFDFESFEKKNNFDVWREQGKRMVLRFVMDVPGELPHYDIPIWLAQEMGSEAGRHYKSFMGRGFAPDYNNEILQSAHGKALARLGDRYNEDPFVAYVEIGSLGVNGEWWVDQSMPALPLLSVARTYAGAYTYAFPNTALLATSPYQSAKLIAAGLYNPFLGDADQTWNWIDMATYGGYEEQIGTDLRGIGAFYQSAPVGASIALNQSVEALLGGAPERLLDQLRECHATYVSGVPAYGLSEDALTGMRIAQEIMGYRLWVRSANWPKEARHGENMHVGLLLRNSGIAPMSQSWPLQLSLIKDGDVAFSTICERVNTKALQPGEARLELDMELPIQLPAGDYQLGLSILDPATNEPAVEFAMVSIKHGMMSILGNVKIVN